MSTVSPRKPSSRCTCSACTDGTAAEREMMRAAMAAAPVITSPESGDSSAFPCCSHKVPRYSLPLGVLMPTAILGRSPRSSRAATDTTFGPALRAVNTPHCRSQSSISGGPSRPRIDNRRRASACSSDELYANTCEPASSMLTSPPVRSATACARANKSPAVPLAIDSGDSARAWSRTRPIKL